MRIQWTDRRSFPPADELPFTAHRSLLGSLGRLLVQLGRSGDCGSFVRPADRQPAYWEDEAYLYLEAVLPEARDREIDVSVYGGKVHIRIEK